MAGIVSLMLVGVTCQVELHPPVRPIRFRTPLDLKRYLKALNDYYAIVGRPRFGRSVDNVKGDSERADWVTQ
ncbi:pro-neuropeptide Y-like [Babylonia areolata]|uniref:pro-neuropeptide Y-like n=1 Tax=Babylonia areolata TaxID=304850 RepID=UPI003FD32FBD